MDAPRALRSTLLGRALPDAILHRLIGLALAVPTGIVLGLARWLVPSPEGMGTHRQLGLGPCVVLTLTGIPCPMCGMTTTFALMADGRVGEALLNQPFGVVLFLATVSAFLLGLWDLTRALGRWRDVLDWVLARETAVAVAILVGLFGGWTYKILLAKEILPQFLDGLHRHL